MIPGGEGLLRALLAQRLDTVLRQIGTAGPQPARAIPAASHDPRAPSRNALDRQAQAGPAPAAAREARSGEGPAATGTTLQARDAAAPAVAATWSGGARAIAALLEPGAPPVRGTAPLWTQPSPPVPPELAQALARAVEGSGLFYEAHLQQFAAGTRSVEALQREPQAALRSDAAAREAPATHAHAPADAPGSPHPSPPLVHPAALPIVQQQLELLATGVFRWTGEPWPGASMEWEVREEEGRRAPDADPEARAWFTRLQLVLPVLGLVDAALSLGSDGAVQVRVAATRADAVQALQDAQPALLERLARARLPVRGCRVEAA